MAACVLLLFVYFTGKRAVQIQHPLGSRRGLVLVSSQAGSAHVQVQVSGRIYSGRVLTVGSRRIQGFYGIPYAEPPLKELRFRKPVPLQYETGRADDVIPVRRKNFPCPQNQPWNKAGGKTLGVNVSENCLHMNVWVPEDNPQGRRVLVFLHGGYFVRGSNDQPLNDGQQLSAEGDVLVVVPNYRLNAFGFLKARIPSAPGNVGIHDVILALRWVHRNIVHFGGSPDKIVLVGRDAGAVLAGYVMVSPLCRGLVKRYILMSGSPFWTLPDNRDQQSLANLRMFAKRIKCDKQDLIDTVRCLSQVDVYDFADMDDMERYKMLPSDQDDVLPFPIPTGLTHSANYDAEDVLLGNEIDIGESLVASSLIVSLDGVLNRTLSSFGHALLKKFGVADPGAAMLAYGVYTATNRSAVMADIVGDFVVRCPLQFLADELSKRGRRVFYFLLERPTDRFNQPVSEFDQSLLFGMPFQSPDERPEMLRFSKNIIDAFTTFAKTG